MIEYHFIYLTGLAVVHAVSSYVSILGRFICLKWAAECKYERERQDRPIKTYTDILSGVNIAMPVCSCLCTQISRSVFEIFPSIVMYTHTRSFICWSSKSLNLAHIWWITHWSGKWKKSQFYILWLIYFLHRRRGNIQKCIRSACCWGKGD